MSITGDPGRSRVHGKRGVGMVLVVGICLGLVLVAATVALITGWLARAKKVQNAADLTALIVTAVKADGDDACTEASEVASKSGGCFTGREARG